MTFEDWSNMYETQEVYLGMAIFYLSYLAAFAFLNMLIGVMVSVMVKQKTQLMLRRHNLRLRYIRRTERRTTRRKVDVLIDQIAKYKRLFKTTRWTKIILRKEESARDASCSV